MGFRIGTDAAFRRSILIHYVKESNVNRNGLYLIIGALIVVAAGLAFYVYREETKPAGIELKIGEGGVSVQEN
ncbi:hypothetical protein JAU75_03605 [Ochrobactrum sp. Q0168]|uniref:hypothetical protein n=1 Tax=Ochrobactrum sp. Q0168 TaxID=2793241 RepID=UPI0018EC3441|nr:hypothetical protein [Ochrobactrum sp. Q0168]